MSDEEYRWLRDDMYNAEERIKALESQVKALTEQLSKLVAENKPIPRITVVKTKPGSFGSENYHFESEEDCWGLLRDEVEDLDVLVGYHRLGSLVGETFTTKDGGLLTVKAV